MSEFTFCVPAAFSHELVPVLNDLLHSREHLTLLPSGRYTSTIHPPLIELLSTTTPSSPAGAPSPAGYNPSTPVSLEVLDLRDKYGVASPEEWTQWLGQLLSVPDFWEHTTQVHEFISYLKELRDAISALFYPRVPISRPTMPCPVCGEQSLKTVPEPEYEVWCEGCRSVWSGDTALRSLIEQIKGAPQPPAG